MNKTDLIDSVASATGISKIDAGKAVDALLDTIAGSLQSGADVRLTGFGSFSVAHRSARMGRNPRTGAQLHIAASNQPKFKAGKTLKSAVNN